MKLSVFIAGVLLLFGGLLFAAEFDDQQQFPDCRFCAMNRVKFGHSRMLIEYEKHPAVATCSLHCAAVELATSIEKNPTSIQVADLNSRELIDAETAHWVLGGEKPGVMTMRGKWAFADRAEAQKFAAQNGGIIVDFDHAMRAAYEDMYKDTMMIRAKRKMKRMRLHQSN